MLEETEARLLCPETVRLPPWRNPLAVRFVPEAFVKARFVIVALVEETLVEETEVTAIVVPVAFVKVKPWKEEEAETVRVPVIEVVARETKPPDWFRAPPTVKNPFTVWLVEETLCRFD